MTPPEPAVKDVSNTVPDDLEKKVQQSLNSSIKDGMAASVMDSTAINFMNSFAVLLQATPLQLSLLSSLPNLASALIQLFSSHVLNWFKSRRSAISVLVLAQVVTLIPMVGIALFFSGASAVWFLILLYTFFTLFRALQTPIWQSQMGDLVPTVKRGDYFAHRNAAAGITALIATLGAGYILRIVPDSAQYQAFALLFSIAFIFRLVSWHYIKSMHYPPHVPLTEPSFTFAHFVQHMTKNNFGRFVLYASLFTLAVNLISPFFAVYLLRDFHFSYFQYSLLLFAPMVSSLIVMAYWGKISDRFGNRRILEVCGLFIALVPLYYVFFPQVLPLVIFEFLINGIFWTGFNLAVLNFLLDATTPEQRAQSASYMALFVGLGAFVGALIGGLLITYFPVTIFSLSVFQTIFVFGFSIRLIVHLFLIRTIQEVRPVEKIRDEQLLFNIISGAPFIGFAVEAVTVVEQTAAGGVERVSRLRRNAKVTLEKIDHDFEHVLQDVMHETDRILNKVEKR